MKWRGAAAPQGNLYHIGGSSTSARGNSDDGKRHISPAAAAFPQGSSRAVEPRGRYQHESVRGDGSCRKGFRFANGPLLPKPESSSRFQSVRSADEAAPRETASRITYLRRAAVILSSVTPR